MRSKKGHSVSLITVQTQPHPQKMYMVRHQTVDGAKQVFPHGGMQHQLSKVGVEKVRQPTTRAIEDRQRPMNHSVTLVIFARQAWKKYVRGWFAFRRMCGPTGMLHVNQSGPSEKPFVGVDVRRL